MLKTIGRIKKLFGSKIIVLYRKETGVHDKVNSNLPNTDFIKHVIYNNSFELSAEDLIAIKSIFKKRSKKILRWLDRPHYRLFAIKLNGVMAHFCLVSVCKKGDFFGMAHKEDLIIMNCNTLEKYRKKGLYKMNLGYICSNWKVSKWAYLNTHPENVFSQKGIEAAGFERMGVYKYFQITRFNIHVRKCGD